MYELTDFPNTILVEILKNLEATIANIQFFLHDFLNYDYRDTTYPLSDIKQINVISTYDIMPSNYFGIFPLNCDVLLEPLLSWDKIMVKCHSSVRNKTT